jgi:hypothetical protein
LPGEIADAGQGTGVPSRTGSANVGVEVGVLVGVEVSVCVGVGVEVGVEVGVCVGVPVGITTTVSVGVAVPVAVAAVVDVAVADQVAEGDHARGLPLLSATPTTTPIAINMKSITPPATHNRAEIGRPASGWGSLLADGESCCALSGGKASDCEP